MRKGFTLIEVLVVAVIVAILAAVAIPAYNGYIRSSKQKVSLNTAGTIAGAAAAYYSENPTTAPLTGTWAAGGIAKFGTQSVKLPDNYQGTMGATTVTIFYTGEEEGTSGTVTWRVPGTVTP